MLKYAHATPCPTPPPSPSTNSAPHEGSDNVVGVVVICPTAQDVIQHEAAAPPRPHPPSHADLLIFLYAYIYICIYVFCMRGAWLTYFKIMPASNKGKKRVQISVRSVPVSGECQPGAGKAGLLLDAYETWLLSPAILYTFPLPLSPFLPPHMCLYNCRAFVIKLERIIVCHISKPRQGQRLPIAYFPQGGGKRRGSSGATPGQFMSR